MVATVSAPANGGLRPPDVELDLSAEVVVEFALKSKERDAVVTWVPTPSSLAEDSSQGIDRRLPERYQLRREETMNLSASSIGSAFLALP